MEDWIETLKPFVSSCFDFVHSCTSFKRLSRIQYTKLTRSQQKVRLHEDLQSQKETPMNRRRQGTQSTPKSLPLKGAIFSSSPKSTSIKVMSHRKSSTSSTNGFQTDLDAEAMGVGPHSSDPRGVLTTIPDAAAKYPTPPPSFASQQLEQQHHGHCELEASNNIDFTQGFHRCQRRVGLPRLIDQCGKHGVFPFETRLLPLGDAGVGGRPTKTIPTTFTWLLRLDFTDCGKDEFGRTKGDYWIGVKLGRNQSDALPHPLPVIYRLVIRDDTTDEIRLEHNAMGLLHQNRDHTMWHMVSSSIDRPDQVALFRDESTAKRCSVFVYLSIPLSYLCGPQSVHKQALDNITYECNTDDVMRMFSAQTFDMIVVQDESAAGEDGASKEGGADEDEELIPERDILPKSDFLIKIIDPSTGQLRRQFNCHKIILRFSSSRYFHNLFSSRRRRHSTRSSTASAPSAGVLQTDPKTRLDVIEFDDVNEKTMEMILRYLYTGCTPKLFRSDTDVEDLDVIFEMSKAARKFVLSGLEAYCQSVMIFDYQSDKDRLRQATIAEMFGFAQLAAVCAEQLATRSFARLPGSESMKEQIWAAVDLMVRKVRCDTLELYDNKNGKF